MKINSKDLTEILRLLRTINTENILFENDCLTTADDFTQVKYNYPVGFNTMIDSTAIASLNLQEGDLEFKYKKLLTVGSLKLQTLDPMFFRGLDFKVQDKFVINSEVLKDAVHKTAYITSDHPIFSGVHWNSKSFQSTDTKRISLFKLESNVSDIIIPATFLNKIKLFPVENILVELNQSFIRFKGNNLELTSRLLAGTFPNVVNMIEPISNEFTLDTKALINTLKRAVTINDEENRATKFTFGEKLVIHSKGAIGEIEEAVEYSGGVEGVYYFDSSKVLETLIHQKDTIFGLGKVMYLKDKENLVVLLPLRTEEI